jgi:otoferlin
MQETHWTVIMKVPPHIMMAKKNLVRWHLNVATAKSIHLTSSLSEMVDCSAYSSTTSAAKPITHDKIHYFLPYWDYKPCMDVKCMFPDLRRRMYNSNMIAKIADKMEVGLAECNILMEEEDTNSEVRLRSCLEETATSCAKYIQITKNTLTGPGSGKTKLDKERMKLCQREVESIGNMARNLRALVTRSSMKERYKTAQTYLQKLRFLVEDVSLDHLVIVQFHD